MKPIKVRRLAIRVIAVTSIGLGVVLAGGAAASAHPATQSAEWTAQSAEWTAQSITALSAEWT